MTIHLGDQLRHFIDEGYPVLGICNGFQVLVRAGLLPGPSLNIPPSEDIETRSTPLRATLTENASAMFECRWVSMAVQPGPCIFTHGIERPIEMPVAHGEGQFVFSGHVSSLQANSQVPLVYIAPDTDITQPAAMSPLEVTYPANPNGSLGNIAGVCNARGNVFGLMPHPERFVTMLQHPQRRSSAGRQTDGLLIFKNAYEYALQCLHNSQKKPQHNSRRFIA